MIEFRIRCNEDVYWWTANGAGKVLCPVYSNETEARQGLDEFIEACRRSDYIIEDAA